MAFSDLVASAAFDVLLCDADGNLFPSEEPAFVASAVVTNAMLRSLGVPAAYAAEELRLATTGKNFRSTALALCARHGVQIHADIEPSMSVAAGTGGSGAMSAQDSRPVLTSEALEVWVAHEAEVVTEHLAKSLEPDPAVSIPLAHLAERYRLAAVSSSALPRLRACFEATALDGFFPTDVTFSAEDSLPVPAGKPDPAIYRLAGERMGCTGAQSRALAIEDSVPGVQSAVGAGFLTVGNLQFVPKEERLDRTASLLDAGACAVTESWSELVEQLHL